MPLNFWEYYFNFMELNSCMNAMNGIKNRKWNKEYLYIKLVNVISISCLFTRITFRVNLCDMIKGNELDVADIVLEILSNILFSALIN